MRIPGLITGLLLLGSTFPSSAAERIFEFGLIVCEQQSTAPVVVQSNVASSELIVPVARLEPASADSLPPDEGRPCADVLTDLTRSGYVLGASTPITRRAHPPEEIFLRNKPPVTEKLEWTLQLDDSIALLSCEPLSDAVANFSHGVTPPIFTIQPGSSCAAYLAAMLALGGEIIARHAVAPQGSTPPAGPVTVYTAYEMLRAFPALDQTPRVPRINQGRARLP